jgi:hypothetical protein
MPLLRYFPCLLLLSFGAGAAAQPSLQYGGIGGLSLATQEPGEDVRAGFNVGVFVDYPVLPFVAVSFEAAFAQKGQSYDEMYRQIEADGDTTLIPGTFTFALDYASFTLAAKPSVTLDRRRGASLYAVAGPRLDVLVREKLLFEGFDQSIRFSIDEHEPTVWGYDVGVGVQLGTLLPAPLLVEARFSGGLTNAFDGATRAKTRNQVVQLRLGVEF